MFCQVLFYFDGRSKLKVKMFEENKTQIINLDETPAHLQRAEQMGSVEAGVHRITGRRDSMCSALPVLSSIKHNRGNRRRVWW